MNLKEKIKNYTTYIVDDRDNKWEVIELSDLQDLLDTDRAEQLILSVVVKTFTAEEVVNELKNNETLDDAITFFNSKKQQYMDYNVYGMVSLRPYGTNLINNYKTLNYEYR